MYLSSIVGKYEAPLYVGFNGQSGLGKAMNMSNRPGNYLLRESISMDYTMSLVSLLEPSSNKTFSTLN